MATVKSNKPKPKIGNVLFVIFLGIGALILVSNLGLGPLTFRTIQSGSMAPTMMPGDFAVVYRTSNPVGIGDIVLFHDEGHEYIHRIVDETGTGYVTKGDANEDVDSSIVVPSQIEGKYVLRVPFIGYPIFYLKMGIYRIINSIT